MFRPRGPGERQPRPASPPQQERAGSWLRRSAGRQEAQPRARESGGIVPSRCWTAGTSKTMMTGCLRPLASSAAGPAAAGHAAGTRGRDDRGRDPGPTAQAPTRGVRVGRRPAGRHAIGARALRVLAAARAAAACGGWHCTPRARTRRPELAAGVSPPVPAEVQVYRANRPAGCGRRRAGRARLAS